MKKGRSFVYAYGVVAPGKLYVLSSQYPAADAYAEIKEEYQTVGGEAANAAIVLSRLGAKVKLEGNWLDEQGEKVLKILAGEGVDVKNIAVKKNYSGIMEIVFSDGETRTVFGRYCNLLLTQRQWEKPSEKAIRQSDLVCLDPFFKEESLRAAELAQKYRIPYVTVDCAPDDHICIHAAAAVISQEYRRRTCGQTPDDQLFLKYQNKAKGLIIFTAGGEEIIYGRFGQEPEVLYPKKIIPVDTSGAGDAFRAGVVWGVLQKWQDKKIISFATALAAKVCRSTPGVLGKL